MVAALRLKGLQQESSRRHRDELNSIEQLLMIEQYTHSCFLPWVGPENDSKDFVLANACKGAPDRIGADWYCETSGGYFR